MTEYNSLIREYTFNNISHLSTCSVKKFLGEGGFGSVELVKCMGKKCNKQKQGMCEKLFVIKKIKIRNEFGDLIKCKGETIYEHFLKEYKNLKDISHNNIRKALDVSTDGTLIMFDYCPGIDLFDFLNEWKSSNTKPIVKLFSQITDAVKYIHAKGIAHMDLKLENIILNQDTKQIKLIDFGESTKEKNTLKKGFVGTTQYMCPEMVSNLSYIPEKIDIWSCGILLYNLMYNLMPWELASKRDKRFNRYTEKGINDIKIFPELNIKYYTEEQEKLLKSILIMMLKVEPSERKSIKSVKFFFDNIYLTTSKKTKIKKTKE